MQEFIQKQQPQLFFKIKTIIVHDLLPMIYKLSDVVKVWYIENHYFNMAHELFPQPNKVLSGDLLGSNVFVYSAELFSHSAPGARGSRSSASLRSATPGCHAPTSVLYYL